MIAIVFGGFLLWLFLHREKPARFRTKAVLTGSELDLFSRLRAALPACVVCPQVAVSALIEPVGIVAFRQDAATRIDGKRVGFAIFDEEMQLIAIVELAHRSRVKRSDVARDAYFSSAGIRTIRFHAKRLPSAVQIQKRVLTRSKSSSAKRLRGGVQKSDIEYQRPPNPWRNTVNIHS